MNIRSRQTNEFTDQQPTRKRLKTGESIDREIALLNESGVSKMEVGQINDAQLFFVKALDCFKAKQQRRKQELNTSDRRSDFSISEASIQSNAPLFTSVHRAPAPTESYEYDEGVHPYTETMKMGDNIGSSLQSVTLYYNVALTFVTLRKFDEASRWFKLAMICVNRDTTPSDTLCRIYHNMGYCCYRMENLSDALLCFQKAYELCQDKQPGKIYTFNARTATAVVLFHVSSDHNKVLQLFDQSLADAIVIYGPKSKEVATILSNIGRVRYAADDFQGALRTYKEALDIRRIVLPHNSIDVAGTICSVGQASHRIGDLDEAKVYYNEFLALQELGNYSIRDKAIITKNLAEIHHKQAFYNEAKKLYEAALEAGRLGFGELHPEVASTLNRLGNWYYESKNMEKALECYSEGLKIEQLTLPVNHPRIIVTLTNLAQIYYNFGDYAAAALKYNHIYALQLEAHGPTSLEVAKAMSTMAEMEYKMKQYDEAFNLFQDALLIQRINFGDSAEGLEVASTMNSLGIVAFAKSDFRVAKTFFSSSLSTRKKLLGPDHKDTATLWYNLATTHEEMGDDDNALSMYKETLRIERLCAKDGQADAVDTLQRIGRLYQGRGEFDEALVYYGEALNALRARKEKRTFTEGKLLNLIGNVHLQEASVREMMECYAEASYIYRESDSPPSEILVIAGYYLYGLAKLHPPCAAVA